MTHGERESLKDELDEHVLALLQKTIQGSEKCSKDDDVSRALLFFLVRVCNTWRSIRTLRAHTHDPEGFMVDAGVLLRAMFDAYLQAEYVVQDRDTQGERARAYLDFEHVERYKIEAKVTGHDNPFADKLKSSPERPEGQIRLRNEYDRVKEKYFVEKRQPGGTVKRGPATRNKWYRPTLPDIACSLGKQAEHDVFVATFHGCVHSSAFAVRRGPMVSPKHVLDWASTIAARVARLNVQCNQIDLGDLYGPILDALCKGYLE